MPKWGLFDTTDQVWLGDDDGPRAFPAEDLAKVAAMVADVRLAQAAGRTRARELPETTVDWSLRDEKPLTMTAQRALRLIDRGVV